MIPAKTKRSPWLCSEDIDGDQAVFHKDDGSILDFSYLSEESINSESLLQTFTVTDFSIGEWPDLCTPDDVGFINAKSMNFAGENCANEEKSEDIMRSKSESPCVNDVKKREPSTQGIKVSYRNKRILLKENISVVPKEAVVSKLCPDDSSQAKIKQEAESLNFVIWALKSLLPERYNLDAADKGSILHATADYIESLREEINSSLPQLGIQEEKFWDDLELESIRSAQLKPQTVTKTETNQEKSSEVKRPPNAFIRFSVAFRKMVSRDFPNRSNREISQMLGSIWRRMRKEDKQPFINQFYADLRQTRLEHPHWNYAGKNANRYEIDLDSVQPERLRPRNQEQKLNYRNMEGRLPFKSSRSNKTKRPKQEIENWVQCDLCNKWRKLPIDDSNMLPEKWTCSMNPDLAHNNCDIEEEEN